MVGFPLSNSLSLKFLLGINHISLILELQFSLINLYLADEPTNSSPTSTFFLLSRSSDLRTQASNKEKQELLLLQPELLKMDSFTRNTRFHFLPFS